MGAGAPAPPNPKEIKTREKYFGGNYYVKFRYFGGINHVKFANFVNFSGKFHKNGYF